MAEKVKTRRNYDSSRRQEQAQLTRRAVIDAARRRFLADGYAATTIPAVAADAGVSVETVYKAFGNKPGLVKAVFDVGVVGDDEPIPLVQRKVITDIQAEPDPRKKLAMYGVHTAATGDRVGALLLVIRAAAETDAGAAELWANLQAERLTGMTMFAHGLQAGGHLRSDVSVEQAADVLWTHNSPELWDLLVRQRGWSKKRFGTWVGQQLAAALL